MLDRREYGSQSSEVDACKSPIIEGEKLDIMIMRGTLLQETIIKEVTILIKIIK